METENRQAHGKYDMIFMLGGFRKGAALSRGGTGWS